ncbi:MAG TPA: bifunctional (p)ppGpp synthetase/guanosine-3',5'-bis(diphosphate) 3'-pyrophosphohydrolase [Spirochaetota bacterium]|nr:bifunctional (p)ppGpp synthetase/guanosine-3',5'-bis(diphosphate) 3'-pyrophosphohydrolase [Spirochaetota bacterium]HPJ34986.1 bifunctional (p)ppGpp synthetase/guanosine-3',5'-bis(diphosphate) 3'-pyrophosphohydrolase [Spirochaetota bacterium]
MTAFELKIRKRDIDTLIGLILDNDPETDITMVRKSYETALSAHEGQSRLSGEPYIIHPLEVAITLAMLKLDTTTICAALLHDVIEDTVYSYEYIKKEFSEEVAMLVDGVTKISSLKNRSRSHAQAETLRKMLLATIKDIRVIIIKLADKLHNMRTIMFQPEHKQLRIAKETMDIYAPIARRLGISRIAAELEDIAFHVINRDEFDDIKNRLALRQNEVEAYIDNVRNILTSKLDELKIKIEVKGRAKSYYSIYRKMQVSGKTFDDIFDIRGIRVITDEVKDCYAILGTVHSLWSPIEGRFKDYIAVPKTNMYQSLHTTVIGPDGVPLEVQIRTREMDNTAEMGIAAHWVYKDGKGTKRDYKNLSILDSFSGINLDSMNTRDFVSTVKMDLYEDEIFVFTPKGMIIKLAKGATPVDFAYAIHTEVGHKCSGAKVNNKMVPLRTKLKSGDIIDIITNKNARPSDAWLKFVKSGAARYKIRNWLRKHNDDLSKTEEELKKKEKKREVKKASVTIPEDEQIKIKNISGDRNIGISIEGTSNVMIKLAQCCQPIPGDEVVGFITRGRGITIHRKSCPSLERLKSEKERFINIIWDKNDTNKYPIKLSVEAIDRPSLLKDVTDEIALAKSNIIKVEAQLTGSGNALLKFILEVKSNEHLNEIIKRIKKVKNITSVYKINEKVVLK